MKKQILAIAMVFVCTASFAQWTFRTIESDFDGSFKKAYTQTDNRGYLIMEQGEDLSKPFFAISGSYFCDNTTHIDLVFIVGGQKYQYDLLAFKARDSRMYYFNDNIWTEEFINHFQGASKCLIRVNQEHCTDEYYTFDMSRSTAAYNFISKK